MFTGLIDAVGTVCRAQRTNKALHVGIIPDCPHYDVRPGDSVAVNGVCLTVDSVSENTVFFTAVHETLSRTTVGGLNTGGRVNLERALRPTDRLGGHFVLGHVDGVGRVVADRKLGESIVRTVWVPETVREFMAPKASVALDGVSLTIAETTDDVIAVSLVPHTLAATTLCESRPGCLVNIECDVIARYIAHVMERRESGVAVQRHNGSGDLLAKMESLGF